MFTGSWSGKFEGTFIEELIPGILHNFANPLNGIIGRTRLLQRRLEEGDPQDPRGIPGGGTHSFGGSREAAQGHRTHHPRVRTGSLTFFKHVSGKFYAIGDRNMQQVNISELVENEIRFFDFYLDFKHNVKKIMDLDGDLHDVSGSPATTHVHLHVGALTRWRP